MDGESGGAPADSRKGALTVTGEPAAAPAAPPPERFRWISRGGLLNRPRILPSVFDIARPPPPTTAGPIIHSTAPSTTAGNPHGSPSPEAPSIMGAREGVPIANPMAVTGPLAPTTLPAAPEPRPAPPPEIAAVDCPFVEDCTELVEKLCGQPGVQDPGTCRLELWNVMQQWVYGKFVPEEFEPRIRAVAYKHGVDLDRPLM